MHGAAQTAKAPPSSMPRAAPARALDEPGADEALGPRQQPHEREPEDDEHEAGGPLEQELVAEEPGPIELGADPEHDEDEREAERRTGCSRATTRRAEPRSPSRSASTDDTAER